MKATSTAVVNGIDLTVLITKQDGGYASVDYFINGLQIEDLAAINATHRAVMEALADGMGNLYSLQVIKPKTI